MVVSACARGHLDRRLDTDGKTGIHLDFCEGLNVMAEAIAEGINRIDDALAMLADGDLSHRMGQTHHGIFARIAGSIDQTADGLDGMVADLVRTGSTVLTSSNQISGAMSDLVRRTTAAEATVGSAVATLESLIALVSQTAESAARSRELTGRAVEDVAKGTEALDRSRAAMRDVQMASAEIAKTATIIDDIAFQTNLLALNAGVEAARAGEHGRGFAIVATEVRALAHRSTAAANAISGIIRRSQAAIEVGAGSVEDGVGALDVISDVTRNIAIEVDAVAQAGGQQTCEIAALRSAVGDVLDTIHSAAKASRTANDATRALDAQAQELDRMASAFTVTRTQGRRRRSHDL